MATDIKLSPQLNEAFLSFATNFFNASSEDKARLFREYYFTEKDIENAQSEEERTKLRNFIELREIFLREISKPDFFLANDTFLDEKFISSLVDIEFKKTDLIANIDFNIFVNAMISNFFIKGERRTLTGRDVTNLYNSVMLLAEDKFHKLTASKISSEIYNFFFINVIKRDIVKTVLLNPFYPIVLQHFIKIGGFTSIDEYQNKAMVIQHRKNIDFSMSNDEIYAKYQQTPLDRITLSSNCKAFSYQEEYRNRHKYGEHQLPDTLFFNCVLKDTELEHKFNVNKQPNIFKLSDYIKTETNDSSYILEALNVTQNLSTPILPSQQTKELEKMQEQIAKMEIDQKRLQAELKAQQATFEMKENNKNSISKDTDEIYQLLVNFGKKIEDIKQNDPKKYRIMLGAIILIFVLIISRLFTSDNHKNEQQIIQKETNTTNKEMKKDDNGSDRNKYKLHIK